MTREEIDKNNKLIAEFMGGKLKWLNKIDSSYVSGYANIAGLKFHKSWDWLMPVVEKIESLNINEIPIEVHIHSNDCLISDIEHNSIGELSSLGSKIKSVYECVVEFIKWYNNEQ